MKEIFYYTADKKNIPNYELPIALINHDDTSSSWCNARCVRSVYIACIFASDVARTQCTAVAVNENNWKMSNDWNSREQR